MRDHFIPAAFMGRFSSEPDEPLRRSLLQVLRPGQRIPTTSSASSIGFVNDLYDVDNVDGVMSKSGNRFVDDLWDEFEPRLSAVLDDLIAGRLALVDWLEVLVPFVASLTVRDRFYGARLVDAWRNDARVSVEDAAFIEIAADKSNLNHNRIIGRNYAMGKLLASDWSIGETDSDLCTSDLGYAYYIDQIDREGGTEDLVRLMVPISRRAFLVISPEGPTTLLNRAEGQWGREVHSLLPQSDLARSLNRLIAGFSQDFVVGSSEALADVIGEPRRQRTPAQIQELQEYWPYRVSSKTLSGVWGALRNVVRHNLGPIEALHVPLEPNAGLTDRIETPLFVAGAERQLLGDVARPSEEGLTVDL